MKKEILANQDRLNRDFHAQVMEFNRNIHAQCDRLEDQNQLLETKLAHQAMKNENLEDEEEVSEEEVLESNASKQEWDQESEDQFWRDFYKTWDGESGNENEKECKSEESFTTSTSQNHSNENTQEFTIPSTPRLANEEFFKDDAS
ncbi:unnamed protein product [Rhodiola kirilowii]